MKAAKIMIILMAAALVVFGLSGAAFAFHDGGVGFCEGCHTMHNSVSSGTVPFPTSGANAMTSTSGGVSGWTGSPLNSNTALGDTYGSNTVGAGTGENQYLLRGSDPSSTCLNCHAATTSTPAFYQEMSESGATGFIQHEAGDFRWMQTTYTYTLTNPDMTTTTAISYGWNHGHDVVAVDFGLAGESADSAGASGLLNAPGSTVDNGTGYPANNLACNSCHDPHGAVTEANAGTDVSIKGSGSYGQTGTGYGVYRLLATKNYDPGGFAGKENGTAYDPTGVDPTYGNGYIKGFPLQLGIGTTGQGGMTGYDNNPPVAIAYNSPSNGWNVSAASATAGHNVYVMGMSEFCADCHNKFLNNRATVFNARHRHPSGVKQWQEGTESAGKGSGNMDALYGNYNDYAGTGDYSTSATSNYWPLVPVEIYNGTYDTAAATTENIELTNQANVMCLTCHRAHASAFDHDTRWDTYTTFLSDSSVLHASSDVNATNAYYGFTVGTSSGSYQRQLCNKCHVQD
ncbi:MAG: hypothetical protein M0018_07205 [Nitrospiraceae bacterium]|nr:hypothetical protein [Nitrospiraceae bacterium]